MTSPISKAQVEVLAEQLVQAGYLADEKAEQATALLKNSALKTAEQNAEQLAMTLLQDGFGAVIQSEYGESPQTIINNLAQVSTLGNQILTVQGQIAPIQTEETQAQNTLNGYNATLATQQANVATDQTAVTNANTTLQNDENSLTIDSGYLNQSISNATILAETNASILGPTLTGNISAITLGTSAATITALSNQVNTIIMNSTPGQNQSSLEQLYGDLLGAAAGATNVATDMTNISNANSAYNAAVAQLTSDQNAVTATQQSIANQQNVVNSYATQLTTLNAQLTTLQAQLAAAQALVPTVTALEQELFQELYGVTFPVRKGSS